VNAQAQRLFISYRREETGGHAGRLYDAMAAQFGEHNVFMDVDLAPGVDFVSRITEAVGACRVLLVVMGPRWATLEGDRGAPRIAEPDDFVRLEVETALRRPEVTVIPLLVAGARMPEPEELPEGLRPITRRNALELSDLRWRYDIGRLKDTLQELLRGTTGAHDVVSVPEPAPRRRSFAQPVVVGALVAGAAGFTARAIGQAIKPSEGADNTELISTAVLRRAETWALVGAALAVWLTVIRGEQRALAGRALFGLALGALAGALGAIIFEPAVTLPDNEVGEATRDWLALGALAGTGAVIGALIGALWIPRRTTAGLAVGMAAGVLAQLIFNAGDWSPQGAVEQGVAVGARCIVMAGVVIATLAALDAREAGAEPSTRVGHLA
jgi:TIR domain